MHSSTLLLSLQGAAIGYEHRDPLAGDINLTALGGMCIALIGNNGCGKSTLLRTIAGLQDCVKGNISLSGEKIHTLSRREIARRVALIQTQRQALPTITVTEAIQIAQGTAHRLQSSGKKVKHEVYDLLATLGIGHLQKRRLGELSDGEYQRVMIATGLAQEAGIILLDEPTAHLDYLSKVAIMKLLAHLAKVMQKCIIISTHDLAATSNIVTHYWLMQHGAVNEIAPQMIATKDWAAWLSDDRITLT